MGAETGQTFSGWIGNRYKFADMECVFEHIFRLNFLSVHTMSKVCSSAPDAYALDDIGLLSNYRADESDDDSLEEATPRERGGDDARRDLDRARRRAPPDRAASALERTRFSDARARVPRFRFEPQLQNTILRLVAAGLGVALVPESICDEQPDGLVARPLDDAPELEVVLKVSRERDNPAVAPLVELIRAQAFSDPDI